MSYHRKVDLNKLMHTASQDLDFDKIKAYNDKIASFWDSDEAKKKPWLEEVPAYYSYDNSNNYEFFIQSRINELLREINYKVWQQKDYSYYYRWRFEDFYVYAENSQFARSLVEVDVFKETDAEIKHLLIECMSLFKQLYNTHGKSYFAIHADLNTIDNEDLTTLCKVSISNKIKNAISLDETNNNINDVDTAKFIDECVKSLKNLF